MDVVVIVDVEAAMVVANVEDNGELIHVNDFDNGFSLFDNSGDGDGNVNAQTELNSMLYSINSDSESSIRYECNVFCVRWRQ